MHLTHLRGLGVSIVAVTLLRGFGAYAQGFGAANFENRPATGAATSGSSQSESEHSDQVLPAHFQATVYEIETSASQAGTLDGKALARQAGTADTLLKALDASGKVRILYRIDQPVNVYSERITVGGTEPMVTGTRLGANGKSINTITYHNMGVIVRLSAQLPAQAKDPSKPNVKASVQLAVRAQTETEIAPGQNATTIRNVSLEHTEPLEYDRPLLMISVNSATEAEQTKPTAHVIRYMFSAPAEK